MTAIGMAACGMLVGAGMWLALYALFPSRQPSGLGVQASSSLRWAAMSVTGVMQRARLHRLLLTEELALVGRDAEAHTLARIIYAVVGATIGVTAMIVAAAAGMSVPGLAIPVVALAGVLFALAAADRPIYRLATARRKEGALAVAAFIDLARILLVGGLPLHTALQAAADSGTGWAFGQIREALREARDRGAPPDAGLERLAARIPVPEFADLKRTVTSARRGASPVIALESRAAAIRSAEAAQSRGEEAAADAQMELPGAVVAIAFVGYLTYPLLTLVSTGPTP
ncbi:type II secretion system F family protein [Frankia sp. Cj3]|uniref:type II secretion system F family protein n=1 Tax=Frankia sp. Cj3 TaxID=2880976 RepID=UPI001EF4812E|nr:type II secretion system F family protein [Frankia sp. Cj3]